MRNVISYELWFSNLYSACYQGSFDSVYLALQNFEFVRRMQEDKSGQEQALLDVLKKRFLKRDSQGLTENNINLVKKLEIVLGIEEFGHCHSEKNSIRDPLLNFCNVF